MAEKAGLRMALKDIILSIKQMNEVFTRQKVQQEMVLNEEVSS